jgi:hypothetical protein
MKFSFTTVIEIAAEDEEEAYIKLENYLSENPLDEVFDVKEAKA